MENKNQIDFGNQYLTYEEYKELGGNEIMSFNLLEFEARKKIDEYTFGRLRELKTQVTEVKTCVFGLINLALSINNGVEINGNVVNYTEKEIENQIKNIINCCLCDCTLDDGTPYLYRGF